MTHEKKKSTAVKTICRTAHDHRMEWEKPRSDAHHISAASRPL